jgi:hypothetical protein
MKINLLFQQQNGLEGGITTSTIQGQTPAGDQNNDLQLLEPTLALTTSIPQYSLKSLQITPINIEEEEEGGKLSTISYKNDGQFHFNIPLIFDYFCSSNSKNPKN